MMDKLLGQHGDGQLALPAEEQQEPWDSYRHRWGGAWLGCGLTVWRIGRGADGADGATAAWASPIPFTSHCHHPLVARLPPADIVIPSPTCRLHHSFTLLMSKGYMRTVESLRNRLMAGEWELGARPIALQL